MMTSSVNTYDYAYVWVWLPGEAVPVVAGKLTMEGNVIFFNYGKSYLENPNAIALYEPELPLLSGRLALSEGLNMPACIRDASPDAWGRRVILNRCAAVHTEDTALLNEITYLLESGSDRTGALDFQLSATEYVPRMPNSASLEELLLSAEYIEKGIPLTPELDRAICHGSSIGGARPKVLLENGHKKYIAKFSSSSDLYNVVKAEFVAMRLARLAGLNVASVELVKAAEKDVLLIERFDRVQVSGGWSRKMVVSALTILGLDEMMARYASYEELAEIIRQRFVDAKETLRELFARVVFYVLCGNTDDHARNHAAFWNGKTLSLTPAYDICPQNRSGNEAWQAMIIAGGERMSQLAVCLNAAYVFLLTPEEGREIIGRQIDIIKKNWTSVCDEAELSEVDRELLWGRQFLNPFALEGWS